jgi:hypothetical protein
MDRPATLGESATLVPGSPKAGTNQGPATKDSQQGSAGATIQSTINDFFLNDGHTRRALADNLRPRALDALTIRARADVAFKQFTASKYQADDRIKATYADPGSVPSANAVATLVREGLDVLSTSAYARRLRIRETDAFMSLIDPATASGGFIGTVPLADLLAYVETRLEVLPSERPRTVMSSCEAEERVEQWLLSVEQGDVGELPPATQGSATSSSGNEEDSSPGTADVQSLVGRQVALLMAKVVAPEQQLRFDVPGRQKGDELARALETFQLRAGPSDVTSYHDFSSLQIAFQHVWTEVFDGQLAPLGKELYCEYVKLKASLGIDDAPDQTIDTLDDLAQLMGEIRDLATIKTADLPPSLQSTPGNSGPGGLPFDGRNPLEWTIGKIAQWLAGKPTLTWDSFETADSTDERPLPLEGDRIQVRFEPGAAPRGQVEIVIEHTDATWWWKGIEFVEFTLEGAILSTTRIGTSNHRNWNPSNTDRLQIDTNRLRTGALEFLKDAPRGIGGWPTGFYRLTNLDSQIKDRMRVTFTWIKD